MGIAGRFLFAEKRIFDDESRHFVWIKPPKLRTRGPNLYTPSSLHETRKTAHDVKFLWKVHKKSKLIILCGLLISSAMTSSLSFIVQIFCFGCKYSCHLWIKGIEIRFSSCRCYCWETWMLLKSFMPENFQLSLVSPHSTSWRGAMKFPSFASSYPPLFDGMVVDVPTFQELRLEDE